MTTMNSPATLVKATTQQVTGALKAAKFKAARRTRRERFSGFNVSMDRVTKDAGVTYYDWEDLGDAAEKWAAILDALVAAGFVIAHGYGEDRVIGEEAMADALRCMAAVVLARA